MRTWKTELNYWLHVFATICVIGCFVIIVTSPKPSTNIHQPVVVSAPTFVLPVQRPFKTVNERQLNCLAKNIFFEGRGTTDQERIRIINVTANRVNAYNQSYCQVVYQPYQFSWTNNLRTHDVWKIIKNNKVERQSWEHDKQMAWHQLAVGYKDITKGALFYHDVSVHPRWVKAMRLVEVTPYNDFYKPLDY